MPQRLRRLIAALARSALVVFLGCGLFAVGAVAVSASAAADGTLSRLRADLRVEPDGSLHVVETQNYDFGTEPVAHVGRVIQLRVRYDEERDQVFQLSGLKASVDGKPVQVARRDHGDVASVTLMFIPPQTGRHTVRFEYDVRGTTRRTPEGLELSWPVVQRLSVPVGTVTARLSVPRVLGAWCFAGTAGSAMPCTATQTGALARPEFVQEGLSIGDQMTVVVVLPSGAGISPDQMLERRWSFGSAFALTPWTIGILAGVVALAGLAVLALWWTRGRDAAAVRGGGSYEPFRPDPAGTVRFEPPDGIRPGQLGTIVDERADVVDIVATVLDLAVRGHLVVEELDRPSPHRRPDWMLHRPSDDGAKRAELLPYEQVVVEIVFAGEAGGAARDSVALSEIARRFPDGLSRVQEQLYADVYSQGWFRQRPDAVRSRWTLAGGALALAGAVLTVVLAAFTGLGLLGVAVVLAGALLVWSGDLAPARTVRGSALLARLHEFRAYLASADGSDLPDSVKAELVSRVLPYAVVFGLEDRWAETLVAAGRAGEPDAGLGWYRAPAAWHRVDLADSIDTFVNSLSGAISARRLRL